MGRFYGQLPCPFRLKNGARSRRMATTVAQANLRRAWEADNPFLSIFGTVNHKIIGKRYLLTAFLFFALGGLEAALMRAQLARPENTLLSPETYNQFFTLHGTTMIFFFATPMLFGFGNYIIPLMLGTRDMAFPRLNAFGYWVFLFSGLFLYSSLLIGQAPDGGWFAYTPLTSRQYSPTLGLDFWTLGLIFLSFSTTAGAVNFIVSILKVRAPGMALSRLPLFAWTMLVTSFAILFAIPPLTVANILLELQRKLGFQFYESGAGGSPLLWQHLFWIFGHPDVYIIFLPAIGIVSEIVAVFSRRRVLGYTLLAMSAVATGIIGFGVWVHHMFAVGISPVATNFFSMSSVFIGIPAGIQVFAWLGTLLSGRPWMKTPLLFVLGFLFLFVLGGLTGVMFPATPFDRQVTDTYFVVAHFHYTLVGGAVFPMFAAFYYWLPKMTGRMLNERLGKWNFWLMFVGFNVAFFPMHINGLLGMPRRVYTYQSGLGWDLWNLIETIGASTMAVGVLLFVVNFLISLKAGEEAGPNPWGGSSLEWATSSPPPPYNFEKLPEVRSRNPLWDESPPDQEKQEKAQPSYLMHDDPTDPFEHETLGTSVVDAIPDSILHRPEEDSMPFWLAVSMLIGFIGLLASLWWLAAIGAILSFVCVAIWLWPNPVPALGEEEAG